MRVTNWRDNLQRVFDAAHGQPFRWGFHDCFQFTARCVAAVSGYDGRILFPRYTTKREALALLEQEGGARGILIKALGEPVHVSRAGVGDVVLIDMGRGFQPAICMGRECFAPGRRKLQPYPTLRAVAAWVL